MLLNGKWKLRFVEQTLATPENPDELNGAELTAIDAEVPGNVELDLERAGLLPDLKKGENVFATRKYEVCRWWYSRTFETAEFAPGERVFLVFEGLDCLATIWINNIKVGESANMLVPREFDVTDALNPESGGNNEIVVRLDSAVLAARKNEVSPGNFSRGARSDGITIRKAPHMFGWDIMPRLVSAGIWRSVRLETRAPTKWRWVYWATKSVDLEKRTAQVHLEWNFETDELHIDDFKITVSLGLRGKDVLNREFQVRQTRDTVILDLNDVEFWWPNGYGESVLYDIVVELRDGNGEIRDEWKGRIGIRTLKLKRSEYMTKEGDGDFVFIVNDEKVYAKGTNWVPLDASHSQDTRHVIGTLEMATDLHCNMIRCWGGNVYEDHEFFDYCDEHGIMIWQDFALGCSIYPDTPEFHELIREEAVSIVKKLRNHASLALWAGNNEIDEACRWSGWDIDPNDDQISRKVLAAVVRNEDPYRSYLPSSPYRSEEMFKLGNHEYLKPEDHLWGPRLDVKTPFFAESNAVFVSEFGFHGMPSVESLKEMLDPEYLWPWQDNPQWLAKAVRSLPGMTNHDYRIPLMGQQMEVMFGGIPENLDDYVLASQIIQAESLKFFIELWRSGKWRRSGLLWWNLRDGWPIISDAIVDYYNRRKLAYEYVKTSQAPLCLACVETDGKVRVAALKEGFDSGSGRVKITDFATGRVLAEEDFTLEPNINTFLTTPLETPSEMEIWLLEWKAENGDQGRNHYVAGPRPYDLEFYKRWLSQQASSQQ